MILNNIPDSLAEERRSGGEGANGREIGALAFVALADVSSRFNRLD